MDRCEGRPGLLAVRRSLCDVDVLSYTGNARYPGCWERKRRPNIRGPKPRIRVSSHTARHSKQVASPARPWSVGRLVGVYKLTCLCLCLCLRRVAGGAAASQAQGTGRQLSQQACSSRHRFGCLFVAGLGMCSVTVYAWVSEPAMAWIRRGYLGDGEEEGEETSWILGVGRGVTSEPAIYMQEHLRHPPSCLPYHTLHGRTELGAGQIACVGTVIVPCAPHVAVWVQHGTSTCRPMCPSSAGLFPSAKPTSIPGDCSAGGLGRNSAYIM